MSFPTLSKNSIALVLSWLAVPALAATGGLVGTVTGPGDTGLPGVTVTVQGEEAGADRTVITGEGGSFRVSNLDTGDYTVNGNLHGFHPASLDVAVREGETARIRLSLSIATFHDTMQVDAPLPHTTMEATELRESAARDVGEALSRMGGVWKVRKGGIANDVSIRGFRQDDITVLIDGARVAGACPNRMDPPAFHLDFAEVDRIEVAPTTGRMAAQGSMGGMVNVVTKKPGAGFHADVSMAAGSWGMINPSATVSYGTDRWAVLGGLSHRSGEPFADGSGERFTETANYTDAVEGVDAYNIDSGWARMYFRPADGHELNLSYAGQRSDDVLYSALKMDAEYDDTDRLVLGYRYAGSGDGTLREVRATAYGTQVDHWMTDTYRTTGAMAPRGWGMGTNATTEVIGGTVDVVLGEFTVGAEAYQRNWDAWTELGMMSYMRQFSIPDVNIEALGLSARWRHHFSAGTQLEVGGRVDRVATQADESKANTDLYYAYHEVRDTSRDDVEPSFSLRLVQRIGRGLDLTAGVARTSRAPDPRERYFGLKRMGVDWVGNPVVAPPVTTGAEVGLTWSAGSGLLTARVWADRVDGFITLYGQDRINMVPGVMNPKAQTYTNVDALLRGVSLDGTAALSSRIYLSGNLSYVRGTKDTYPELNLTSENLAEMPPLSARLALRWQNPRFFAEAEGLAAAEQDEVDTDLDEVATPGWAILNLKGGMNFGRWRVQLILDNVFDRTYREHFSYLRNPYRSGNTINEPGRSYAVTLGWRM
jgi:iron complex outermembrane receptor protein